MAARSIASLTLGFGLVSIPVKLYSATESSAAVRFNLLAPDGSRVRQQYVSEKDDQVVPRNELVKGYAVEKDKFVLFSPDELKLIEDGGDHGIDIVSFIPEKSVDPLYYDKAYLLAPDKRGGKPYALLTQAMLESGRCALARWRWKGRQNVVQVRAAEDGLVLQQLLYADEVRSLKSLDIEHVTVSKPELQLALQLIDQISADAYDPTAFVDEERQRILALIDAKVEGQQVIASTSAEREAPESAQVIDLMAALKASLSGSTQPASAARRSAASGTGATKGKGRAQAADATETEQNERPPAATPSARKGPKRAASKSQPGTEQPAKIPVRARASR